MFYTRLVKSDLICVHLDISYLRAVDSLLDQSLVIEIHATCIIR